MSGWWSGIEIVTTERMKVVGLMASVVAVVLWNTIESEINMGERGDFGVCGDSSFDALP